MEGAGIAVYVEVGEVFFKGGTVDGDRFVVGVEFPEEGGHDKELGMVARGVSGWLETFEGGEGRKEGRKETDVFITTSCGSTPYFLASKTFNTVASNPFNEAILSAKRQLMGMVGSLEPSNLTLLPYSCASDGRDVEIKGLWRMPSWNNFCVSPGME